MYVNALLAVTEELQSRIHGILTEDGLASYKEEYQDEAYDVGSAAGIAFLHTLSEFMGWAFYTFRYGPYTNDAQFMRITRKINKTLESKELFPGDAFRFTMDERVALGKAIVTRVGGNDAANPEFESLPLYQFIDEIKDEESRHASLYRSNAIRRTLEAIDRADRAESLEGHERLAVLQNLLVDLLMYLENKEGFRVRVGERSRVQADAGLLFESAEASTAPASNAASDEGGGSGAAIVHQSPGRIRLRIPRVKTDETYRDRLQTLIASVKDVTDVHITAATASVVVIFPSDIPAADFAETIRQAVKALKG